MYKESTERTTGTVTSAPIERKVEVTRSARGERRGLWDEVTGSGKALFATEIIAAAEERDLKHLADCSEAAQRMLAEATGRRSAVGRRHALSVRGKGR